MSKITIELPSYKQPKNYGKHVYQEWDSKGKYTYDPETGIYGYYRKLRFGSIVGYCDGDRASFCLRDTKGKEKASLNVKTRHLGGKGMVYRKLRPLRGLRAAENFLSAMQTPMFYTDSKEFIVGEMRAVVSLFINMVLQPWERNSFPSCSIETKQYDDCVPPCFTVLFPLLHSKDYNSYMFATSKSKSYKALRGEVSLSNMAKHFLGSDSAVYNKLMQRILSEGKLYAYSCTISVDSTKELLGQGMSPQDLLRIPDYFYSKYHLVGALQHMSLDKLMSLEPSSKRSFNYDSLSMLGVMPAGMKVGKGIRNMTHLHEVLSFMVNRLRDDDFKVWTHPQFNFFNHTTILGLEVVFPKTANTLKEWGTELGLCIGSYANRIHSGESICFALYKAGKPVVCVELSGYDFCIIQVQGRNHSDQPQKLWDAIKDSMDLETCSYTPMIDWERPKEPVDSNLGSPELLYKEAVYRTTRIEEWAYIMCAHESREYCPLGDRPLFDDDGEI